MKQQFISFDNMQNLSEINELAPWACDCVITDNGVYAFESMQELNNFVEEQGSN